MTMPGAIARSELTTQERCEFLLGVIACAITRRRPADIFPWVRSELNQFLSEVSGG